VSGGHRAWPQDGRPWGGGGGGAGRRPGGGAPPAKLPDEAPPAARKGELKLVRYRALFSGPAVERVPELQFQRPHPEVELAEEEAHSRGIRNGDEITIRSNGTAVTLRARLSRELRSGVVRVPDEHAADLQPNVEIANVSIALILSFALGSIGVYGAIVGGWASQSKFALLGSMRTCAQLVSYEVSLALSVLGVVLMGQSLNLVDIVNKQGATIW